MAKASFYFIYLDRDPTTSLEDANKIIDNAVNWYRLNPRVWIVYTTSNAEKWYSRLKPLVKNEGNVFVCKLDVTERQGWMNKEFWSWFHEMENKYNRGAAVNGQ